MKNVNSVIVQHQSITIHFVTLHVKNVVSGKKEKKDNPNFKIDSFKELHRYFDANYYVETLFTKNGEFMLDEANLVLEELDNFIKELNK